MYRETCVLTMVLLTAATAAAQAPQPEKNVERRVHIVTGGPGGPGRTFEFISHEMGFAGRTVAGAPFSGEGVTERVQVLADGNRIVSKTTVKLYRDNEGRTRRENLLPAVADMAGKTLVNIHDPVAGVTWILHPDEKIARKVEFRHLQGDVLKELKESGGRGPSAGEIEKELKAAKERETYVDAGVIEKRLENLDRKMKHPDFLRHLPPPGIGPMPFMEHFEAMNYDHKVESLGTQTIEGVKAEGTRTSWTIPAGAIGNERPIDVVSERWYSPELQTVVLSKHNDPRAGETTYRLASISRNEPAKSLFEVPADYKVEEGPTPNIRMLHRRR